MQRRRLAQGHGPGHRSIACFPGVERGLGGGKDMGRRVKVRLAN